MLYTRKGDDGSSGAFGNKNRYPKDSLLFEALGTLDELNSLLGICFVKSHDAQEPIPVQDFVRAMQEDLFVVQAELAGAEKKIAPERVLWLETTTNDLEKLIEPPKSFLIAGTSELSAFFDLARTVARRAERAVIRAKDENPTAEDTRKYMNRLSSLLYALARYAAHLTGEKESAPTYKSSN